MPFTVSHAVLAPILCRFSAGALPIAALAIGCMAPDLYRIFTSTQYDQSHQWRNIFSFTIWIGFGFCVLWYALYRPVLYRIFSLEDPLNLYNFKRIFIFILSCLVALSIGISTHLIWDGLTHTDFRTFAFHNMLAQPITLFGYTYPLHRLLQIGSSIIALPFVIWMMARYMRIFYQPLAISQSARRIGFVLLLLSFLLGMFSMLDYLRHIPQHYYSSGLYHITGRAMNEFAQGFMICLSLGSLLFLFLDRGRRLT